MINTLSLITYGNGDILREVFNALAAAMRTDSAYGHLIHLAIGIAGAWAMLQFIQTRSLVVLTRWFALYYLAFYVIFMPQATVNILDRANAGRVYTVDHVPLGLAILASYTSVIGDGLTQLTEENFSLPNDLRYSQTGMVMAANLVTAASTFQIHDPVFENNLQDFINQCVFYDILLHKYSAQDLLSTGNIWQLVSQNASPARAFLYNQTIVTCQAGVSNLARDWQTAIDQASQAYGARLFPSNTDAKTALLQYLPISYSFLMNLSSDASSLIQQNLMANAIQNGILGWSARSKAPAALSAYAFNRAQQQIRLSNRTLGDLAAYWLPLLKNALEGILYGAFIFVFLLLPFPFGFSVLKNYAYSLLWLQLWSPLYAIINLYANYYAQSHSLAAAGGQTPLLNLTTQASLAQVNADMSGLAGYLSLCIPLLATAIVKGTSVVMAQLAQYVGGNLQSSTATAAAEAASGNFSLGNLHLNTQQANTISTNHIDSNARTSSGLISNQLPGGSQLTVTPSGSTVMNNQAAISNLGTNLNLASSIRDTALQQADSAYSAAMTHQHAYSEAISAARRAAYDLSEQQGISMSQGVSLVISESESQMHALSELSQNSHQSVQSDSRSQSNTRSTQAQLGLQGNLGVGLSGISPLKANVTGSGNLSQSWSHTHNTQQNETDSQSHSEHKNQSETVDHVLRGVQEGSYRATSETGERLLKNITTSLDRAQQEQQLASQQLQVSQSYRQVASEAEEHAVSINSNASQELLEALQKKGQTPRQIEHDMVHESEQVQQVAEQWVREKVDTYLKHPTNK